MQAASTISPDRAQLVAEPDQLHALKAALKPPPRSAICTLILLCLSRTGHLLASARDDARPPSPELMTGWKRGCRSRRWRTSFAARPRQESLGGGAACSSQAMSSDPRSSLSR